MKVLFVCLGNICRSPLGEGILQHKINTLGLNWETDSAGTSAFHAGEKPDSRSIAVARDRNIDISKQRSRQFHNTDFQEFDHILVMDQSNYNNVIIHAKSEVEESKVTKLLDFGSADINDVPDPYYEGGFDYVFDLIENAVDDFIVREQ